MPAVKSENRINAKINKYYIIHVYEYKDTIAVELPNGKTKAQNIYYPQEIVSAATLSRFIENEKLKIELFNEVLDAGIDVYTRLIRKRLKIEFRSK